MRRIVTNHSLAPEDKSALKDQLLDALVSALMEDACGHGEWLFETVDGEREFSISLSPDTCSPFSHPKGDEKRTIIALELHTGTDGGYEKIAFKLILKEV